MTGEIKNNEQEVKEFLRYWNFSETTQIWFVKFLLLSKQEIVIFTDSSVRKLINFDIRSKSSELLQDDSGESEPGGQALTSVIFVVTS